MNFSKKILIALLPAVAVIVNGCSVNYSFSGASIPVEAQTVSIPYFPNNAPMVAPSLSATLTDKLQDKFARQTRLQLVRENGDFAFEGEITGYTSEPAAITAEETAAMNRLKITVTVKFTNAYEPENNYNKSFQAFAEYNANLLLQTVQDELINQIADQLVTDIFNAAASNW